VAGEHIIYTSWCGACYRWERFTRQLRVSCREGMRNSEKITSGKAERLSVKAIEMAFQYPLPHWGRSSARFRGSANSSRSAGFVEGGTRRRSIGRARRRYSFHILIWHGLSESGCTKRKPSQKVGSAFGMCLGCNKRGRLGEPSRNGSTGSPCVERNWRFFVHDIFVFKNGGGPE
jgi:hypothetical protein